MRRLRIFRRDSVEAEVDHELAFHLEMTVRDLMERGMSQQQARTEAERRFGDRVAVDAECRRYGNERERNVRRAEYRDELRQDLSFAIRQLLKARGFTAIAVLTLALGIGATAAVFSVLDAVVLRPLPFPHPQQLVMVNSTDKGKLDAVSAPEYLAMRHVHDFQFVAAGVFRGGATLKLGDTPEMIDAARVSADYFNVFGVQPVLGRAFNPSEDAVGQSNVVVISHRLWLSHFGADRAVIGHVVSIDGTPHTIVGVMPASFDVQANTEQLWLPLALGPDDATNFGEHYLEVVARLRPGASSMGAAVLAVSAMREVAERIPHRSAPTSEYGALIRGYTETVIGDYRGRLLILLGAVGFVMLIACSNVANLLLARGSSRSKELAIRAALGAGRARLLRQLLTESLALSIAGALAGLGVAFGLLKVILAVSPADVPRLDRAGIDWRVLMFTLALAVVSSVIFGLLPALRAAGPQLQGALREGGRDSASTRDRLRAVLVAAEVALAITLLVGSGLLIRSALLMQRVTPGFDPRGVLTSRLVLPAARYATPATITRTYREIRDEAARTPGIRSAALTSIVPLSRSKMGSSVRAEEQPKGSRPGDANVRQVSSGYFATMGIPLLAGRDIDDHDGAATPHVIVINEALAKMLWPRLDPRQTLGKRIEAIEDRDGDYREVVGVVGDVHDVSLSQPALPEFYFPFEQTPDGLWPMTQRSLVVVVRTMSPEARAESLVEPLRRIVASVDPSLPLADKVTMESYLHDSLQTARMSTILLSTLGGIALALAMIGIYGVVSYFVSQRTREIGLRVALGATPRAVWQFVMNRGLRPIVVGLVLGVALSLGTTSVLRGQLYGVTPRDPFTLVFVGALLLLIALVAMYVPARRAMRVAPLVALNEG